MPGVTVEAASPALIEKVRTVVSDGTGQYRLENLVPGVTVTYTLPGFTIVKRDGVELTTGVTVTLNADMQRRRRAGNDHGHRRDAGRGRAEQHPDAARAARRVIAALPASAATGICWRPSRAFRPTAFRTAVSPPT